MTGPTTFRTLEPQSIESAESPLDEWYNQVRDTPIENFDDGDLSRACRQRLFLRYVVPISISRLEANPLAGDMFDGELLISMQSIPKDYWHMDRKNSERLLAVIERAKRQFDDDILRDAERIASSIEDSRRGE